MCSMYAEALEATCSTNVRLISHLPRGRGMVNWPGSSASSSSRVERCDDGQEAQAGEGEQRLVAALGVFFGVVGHADHFGDGDGVEAAEGLGGKYVS
jgi:hypothetical protein